MRRLFAILALVLLLLAGCGKQEAAPNGGEGTTPAFSVESGKGEAVVPEEGDIVIPIGE
ncbi:MAG: hypothetical protein IKU07_09775 [Oscillospiraceae bacterium]|nr:hypothetical protein [Oscillospiraceae bacterium]